MAKGYILSDSDVHLLRRMKEFIDRQPVNTLESDDQGSAVLAPEVYVARVPVNGIPPLSIGRNGDPDVPGSAVCDIYKIYLESSGRPVMEYTGFTRTVYNVSVAWIDSKYAIIKRDKFWAWVVDCPCTTEETGTATTGTGTTGTATTGTATTGTATTGTATTGTATTGTSTTGTGTTGTSTTGTATTGTSTTGTATTGTATTGTATTGTATTGTGTTGTGTTGTATTGTATATATATGTSTGSGTRTGTGTGSGNCVEVLKDVTVECVNGEIVVTKVFQTVMICNE